MVKQGTTTDFIHLINAMAAESIPLAPPGQVLFIFDPPGTYERSIGFYFNAPVTEGGMDAPLG